jgi:hypothetical protein
VVEQIEQIVEAKVEAKKDVLATKGDLNIVKDDINNVRLDLLNVRNELTEKIHKSKIETIVWIVGIGVLQFIPTILEKKYL